MSAVEDAAKVLAEQTALSSAHIGMAIRALASAGLLRPDGDTRTEWGVKYRSAMGPTFYQYDTEERARARAKGSERRVLMSRTATSYPDTVTPWVEVPS